MEKSFRVAVDDSEVFRKVMTTFNEFYKTDFTIERTEFLDGVEFVFLKFENATLDELFLLGYFYGGSPFRKEAEAAADGALNSSSQPKSPYWRTDF